MGGDDGLSWNLMPPVVWAGGGQRIEKKKPKKSSGMGVGAFGAFCAALACDCAGTQVDRVAGAQEVVLTQIPICQVCACAAVQLLC